MKTCVQQRLRRFSEAGIVSDLHTGEQLCFDTVGLQSVKLAQHRLQLHRLGGGHRVGKQGGGTVIRQPLNALGGDVGVQHHRLTGVQQRLPLGQQLRSQVLVDLHIADGQRHIALFIGDEEISGGAALGDDGGLGDVDAQLPAACGDFLGVDIVPEYRQQTDVHAQQSHVVSDVPPHTAQAHPHHAGIGVPHDGDLAGPAADVHIYAAHHSDIGGRVDDVALAGDVALFHQVGDVHRHGGSGDPRLACQLLLGDQGVLFDPVQKLPLPLGHGYPSFISKNLDF